MDSQAPVNKSPTEIKKCPYYDPVTRETIKPGKTCPEYNTPKGCPYAHPFQVDKWDGETPFTVPAVKPNSDPPLDPFASAQREFKDNTMNNSPEALSTVMETGSQCTQPPTPLDTTIIPRREPSLKRTKMPAFIPASQYPSSTPFLSLQREAVGQFLTNLIATLHCYRIETTASEALSKLKTDYESLCKSYLDAEPGEDLPSIISPGAEAAWIAELKKKTEDLEDAEGVRWSRIDGLVSMDGKFNWNPNSWWIGAEEDMEMRDVDTGTALVVGGEGLGLTEAKDLIVNALNHYRTSLNRGVVGERIANLRARLDRIRMSIEAKEAPLVRPNTSSNEAGEGTSNVGIDTEMKVELKASDLTALLRIAAEDLQRLEDLQELAENMNSPIDEMEDWGTAERNEEKFDREMRIALEEITKEFIRHERAVDEAGTAAQATSMLVQSKLKEMLERMQQAFVELEDIRNTSEALLRMIGPVEVFDENNMPHLSVVLQGLSTLSTTLETDLQTLFGPIDARLTLQNSLHRNSPPSGSILRKTLEVHEALLAAHPTVQEARKPLSLSAQLSSPQEVQGSQRVAWYSEYEELREMVGRIVGPLVARTDAQEEKLMQSERVKRGSAVGGVGGGVYGEEGGGLVSMHVSVEGAMG